MLANINYGFHAALADNDDKFDDWFTTGIESTRRRLIHETLRTRARNNATRERTVPQIRLRQVLQGRPSLTAREAPRPGQLRVKLRIVPMMSRPGTKAKLPPLEPHVRFALMSGNAHNHHAKSEKCQNQTFRHILTRQLEASILSVS